MKLLFCGDVMGKMGRMALKTYLPKIKEKYHPDVIVLNGENAAHGLGLTPKIYEELRRLGADVITMGNHTFDKPDVVKIWMEDNVLVRPLNYPENTAGKGYQILEVGQKRLCVVQVLGRSHMGSKLELTDPFLCMQNFIQEHQNEYDLLMIDFHAETTAEKVAMGYLMEGQAVLVAGTHTHIPTHDAHVLPNGTAYITDVGMCGDYTSVIGMTRETAFSHFGLGTERMRWEPATDSATLCGVLVEIDDKTNKARKIRPVILGDTLENSL